MRKLHNKSYYTSMYFDLRDHNTNGVFGDSVPTKEVK